jgi:hypothetical protein
MLAIASFIWFVWPKGEEIAEAPPQRSSTAPLPSPPELRLPVPPPLEAYRVVIERPLFHPGRRPFAERSAIPVPPRNAAPSSLPPPQGFILRGTVMSAPVQSAIFERAAKKDYVRVQEGGQLEGWTLVEVTRSGILLRAAGQELSMKLQTDPR